MGLSKSLLLLLVTSWTSVTSANAQFVTIDHSWLDLLQTQDAPFLTQQNISSSHSGKSQVSAHQQLLNSALMSLKSMKFIQTTGDVHVASVTAEQQAALSFLGHQVFLRCGNYVAHDSLKEALAAASAATRPVLPVVDYSITQQAEVAEYLSDLSELNILGTIQHLSKYKNRYYASTTGIAAAKWIAGQLTSWSSHRSDVNVKIHQHKSWGQPSVIATIKGASPETIIIGGHLDSISGDTCSAGGTLVSAFCKNIIAPGADDNASGIATWMEVFRVLVTGNYVPAKTIVFMGYAAEELGLLGSKEIAQQYALAKTPVIGVMQLDMTNHQGSSKDIYLMTDFTSKDQNTFLGKIIDEYVNANWGYSACGYPCSDHASWNSKGYPASMPFESSMEGINQHIHTPQDTLAISGDSASHAFKFAKMALAYAIELDR